MMRGPADLLGQTDDVDLAQEQLSRLAGVKAVEKKKNYPIEVGDRLKITIYPSDEYIRGGDVEVSTEGTITLSLIGKVQVKGLKVLEVEQKIVDLLSQDYLVSPVVVIEVAKRTLETEKQSVAVLGQVKKPGAYDIPPEQKFTLLQLISTAGGFTEVANAKKIKVIRKKGGKTQVIRANAEAIISGNQTDIELVPEDVVHVGESFF